MSEQDREIVVEVERPVARGRMLARHEGRVVFVAGAIPGERVRARVTKVSGQVWFADTTGVIEASADRREPMRDPACGGMTYAHIAYPRQLELKREVIADALRRIERDVPSVAVDPAESAARKAEATEQMRRSFPDWTWNGPEVPSTKPWFRGLYVGADGRIWVRRSQPGIRDAAGEWTEPTLFDVYEPDGRFLGEARGPDGFRTWPEPAFAGDTAWAAVESADGVLRVQRLVARAPRTN